MPLGTEKNKASAELGAMLQGEDAGVPGGVDAQHIPYQAIAQAHPALPLESAGKLSGTYIYPDRIEGAPIEVLQAHEDSHLFDKIANMKMSGSGFEPSEGVPNKGFQPVKRTRGFDQTTPAGIENWLLWYPPENRNEERKAHLKGLDFHNALKSVAIFITFLFIATNALALECNLSKNYYGNYGVTCAYPGYSGKRIEHPCKASWTKEEKQRVDKTLKQYGW